jgi:adenosylcobinamide kinase/adenosylcobinamide-phosphate guanylyltransferase
MGTKGGIVLVLGGARSGKSEFAEQYVLHAGTYCGYVATAEILDEEMRERVRLHQARRGRRWLTFEAPYDAERVLSEAGARTDAILFDDITLYLSNLLYGKHALQGTTTEKAAQVSCKLDALLEAARRTGRTVVFVSNDVGAGIVPDNAMAREYRDIAGWANQQLGRAADRVFYVIAGQAVDIKQLAFRFPDGSSPVNPEKGTDVHVG